MGLMSKTINTRLVSLNSVWRMNKSCCCVIPRMVLDRLGIAAGDYVEWEWAEGDDAVVFSKVIHRGGVIHGDD